MNLVTFNTVLLVACCANGIAQFTAVDQLLHDFWSMEDDLLERVFDNNRASALITSEEIIRKFKNFNDRWKQVFDSQNNEISEMVITLYDVFRKTMVPSVEDGAPVSFSKAMLEMYLKQINNIGKDSEDTWTKLDKDICSAGQSGRQLVLNFYDDVAIARLKGYVMVLFSRAFLHVNNKGDNYITSLILSRLAFKQQIAKSFKLRRQKLQNATDELRRCDPEAHREGSTYVALTNVLQGIVMNEVSLNPQGTCIDGCHNYEDTKTYSCEMDSVCSKQRRCKNRLRQCWSTNVSYMSICPSKTPQRRYDFIQYANGKTLGRHGRCNAPVTAQNWIRWFVSCSYCVCLCDEDGLLSDRYISMRVAKSDIFKNKVVTGLRFVKKNRLLHLQVQEGKLLPHGRIEKSSVRWVPVDPFKILDARVYLNQDYFKVTWENRAIDLDDLKVSGDELLTGVRFMKLGAHLSLEILSTPFNFATGTLKPRLSRWVSNPTTEFTNPKRTKVTLRKPDIPTRIHGTTAVDSTSNQFVEITHSDFDFDAAQTTVPFFDAQPVESRVPVPLSGAGIYHKGRMYSGGFIAPKIMTYDPSRYLMDEDDVSFS